MHSFKNRLLACVCLAIAGLQTGAAPNAQTAVGPLAWDATTKEYFVKAGETNLPLAFYFTNAAPVEVIIKQVLPSCGCTSTRLPELPWTVGAGASDKIDVSVNVTGKRGQLHKTLFVDTSVGPKVLTMVIHLPDTPPVPPDPADRRELNRRLATANRQAVFVGDCARCHAEPARGKFGKELFLAACGICHETEQRATMVPDLRHLNHPTNAGFWLQWTTCGRPGTLMPAFADSAGGPLNERQIKSLAAYLTEEVGPKSPGETAR